MTTKQHPKAPDRETIREYSMFKCDIGDLMLVADGTALVGVYFADCEHVPAGSKNWTLNERHPVLRTTTAQLEEYFEGKRTRFSVPLRRVGTEFQEKIWREITRIPYGQTITYSELAKRAGASHAIRAVGTATGRNPISIIVPCHRVVGKDGAMCGFAGGLDRKRALLAVESADAAQTTLKLR